MIVINISGAAILAFAHTLAITLARGGHSLYLHFWSPEILALYRRLYGSVQFKHGDSINYVLMNAHNFDLFISFSGDALISALPDLKLYDFFQRINVPTIAVQHGLFQYGIGLESDAGLYCGHGGVNGLKVRMIADYILPWTGERGIGFPVEPETAGTPVPQDDFTLITSNVHWTLYDRDEKAEFYRALFMLVSARRDVSFIWRPHPAEFLFEAATIAGLRKLKLPNLKILTPDECHRTSCSDHIAACRFAISSLSTTLVDLERHGKKTLVFATPSVAHLKEQISAETFASGSELIEKFTAMVDGSPLTSLATHVPAFDKDSFLGQIDHILQQHYNSNQWRLSVALEFIRLHTSPGQDCLTRLRNSTKALFKKIFGKLRLKIIAYKTRLLTCSRRRISHARTR